MRISEIYRSRQGEGRLTGQPSVFLRTSGCNLRCDFCDTPYTSWNPEGRLYSLQEIIDEVCQLDCDHVVITGGEPMLPAEMVELTNRLADRKLHITIETAGTVYRDVKCDLMSISPKLSNSTPSQSRAGAWHFKHESTRLNFSVLSELIRNYDYQLKFVVASGGDLEEIELLLQSLEHVDRKSVMLMPEGVELPVLRSRAKWIQDACRRSGFTYCPRKHIEWYGNRRGT